MATDLERFLGEDGRGDAIERVARQIEDEGITYIYYQFVSVTGRVMGKGIPAAHWRTTAVKGFQLVYGATANLFMDRHGRYIGYGPEAAELVGLPDVGTFCRLPWDPKTARVFCTLFRGREETEDPGGYLTSDCRGNLHRIHREFQEETGLQLRVGCEPEMMWLKTNPDGTPSVEGATKPYCYHIDQFSELQPVIHKVIEYAGAMGLDMIQGDHEDAPGQLELNFNFGPAETTADRLTTYRQICRQVGREYKLFPCFMPKPFMGVSANGCHHNFSLWQGETNMFLPDGENQRLPGKTGVHAIGGILAHLRALTAITAPTVNSYRRFADAGFWAPVFADWGYQNRTTALRVSAPGRFEYRSVDSAVNPYLSCAGLLVTMREGLAQSLDPGPPEEGNIYDAIEAGKHVERIPSTLGEALDALDADPIVRQALPGEMLEVFTAYKRDEWERFISTVSEWDVKEYLDILRDRPGDPPMSDPSADGAVSSAFAHLGAGHILVFQHLTSETPGMVGEHLVAAGFEMTTVELDAGEQIPDLEPYDALVVMGGPMDVWDQDQLPWLAAEKAAIRRWVALERPYLGVCLGHQLLADALGGRVGRMKSPEVGVLDVELLPAGRVDPLLGMLPERLPALQWHHAEVVAPPAGAEVLATSTRCALQAFRVGHWAWGLQFHIEADVQVVQEWCEVPAYRAALASSGDGDPDWLTRAVLDNAATMRTACRSLSTALVWVIDKSRTARSWAGLPPAFDRDLEARGALP